LVEGRARATSTGARCSTWPAPRGLIVAASVRLWRRASAPCRATGVTAWSAALDTVVGSLVALKAMIQEPSGGVVAAQRPPCPKSSGAPGTGTTATAGSETQASPSRRSHRNRCLSAAKRWRTWQLRAAAGDPRQLQIMYGLDGERWLPELEVPWLADYAESSPVRVATAPRNSSNSTYTAKSWTQCTRPARWA
jgi:GH15 family glucan-1,4-alpha-glucosidase